MTAGADMTAHGTVYLSNTPPAAQRAADGVFVLTLLAYDRLGRLQTEPWRITWAGGAAEDFWIEHRAALTAGCALHLECRHLRTHQVHGRHAEIHARVTSLRVLPRQTRTNQTAPDEALAN